MKGTMKERDFVDAPRIEVAIAPDEKGANVNVPSTLFDVWLVMHMPGEEPSMGLLISGGPFDREGAQKRRKRPFYPTFPPIL